MNRIALLLKKKFSIYFIFCFKKNKQNVISMFSVQNEFRFEKDLKKAKIKIPCEMWNEKENWQKLWGCVYICDVKIK